MLLIKDTYDKFGYNPYDLKDRSNKKVVCKCDYCGTCYEPTYDNRNQSLIKLPHVPKDCCQSCRPKKTMESWEILGVKEQKIEEMILKQIQTNQEKYGADFYTQTEEGRNKLKMAWEEMTPEQKSKIILSKENTMTAKYGGKNTLQSSELLQKITNSLKKT